MVHERKRLELLAFMKERGHSLAQFGSAEYGLDVLDAIEFIGLIKTAGLSVLGIEKWTKSKDSYSLASLDGWISDLDDDVESNSVSATTYLKGCLKGPPALYTVQF